MGNSRSSFSNNFPSSFNTRMFRSKLDQLESTAEENSPEALEQKIKNRQNNRNSTFDRRSRRRSVSVDVRSRRRMSSAIHENLVKINFVRNIRDVYSGVDSEAHALGEGTWGTVKLVRRRSNPNFRAAVKILQLSKELKSGRLKELRSEILLLQQIDHPHIAKLYETYEEEGCNLYLVMELFTGGELFDRVIALGHFRESKACSAVKQMVGAVQYLHSKGIVHRDLKLENFMYRSKKSDNLVLIDFGLSTKYGEDKLNEMVGSSYYMAPEVMKRKYGRECDLWSIGVIAYMLLCGHPPFAGDTDEEIMKKVKRGKYHFNHSAFKKVSDDAIDFVSLLLQYDPSKRLSGSDALKHPFLLDQSTASQRRGSIIEASVVKSLKNFADTNRFKKIALQAVAYSTRYEDIAHLQELFEDIDKDSDGYITLEELRNALQEYPEIAGDDKMLRKIFSAMDIDGTQKVHLNEFIAATLNHSLVEDERILREAFRKLDIGETGEIDQDDLSELLGKDFSPKQVDLIFTEFLKDKEGGNTGKKKYKINQEEFIQAMRKVKYEQTQPLMTPKPDPAQEDDQDEPPI